MTKKTTIFLDPRSIEQKQLEQTEEELQQQLEEQERQENLERGMAIINGLIAYIAILPLLFMFAFNVSLTKVFSLDRIGYVESLGIVIVARILRGAKK